MHVIIWSLLSVDYELHWWFVPIFVWAIALPYFLGGQSYCHNSLDKHVVEFWGAIASPFVFSQHVIVLLHFGDKLLPFGGAIKLPYSYWQAYDHILLGKSILIFMVSRSIDVCLGHNYFLVLKKVLQILLLPFVVCCAYTHYLNQVKHYVLCEYK